MALVEHIWQDDAGTALINLYRRTADQAIDIKGESMPDLTPAGQVVDVAGSGARLFVGTSALRGGAYTVTVGTYGRDRANLGTVQRQVLAAAARTRFVVRDGFALPVSPSKLGRNFRGSALTGGEVSVTFECASAYWYGPILRRAVVPGVVVPFTLGGDGPVMPRIEIAAGGQDLTDLVINHDGGVTRFLDPVPAGQTLAIDARPGIWAVTLNGADRRLRLRGPQPVFNAGQTAVYVNAPGAAVTLIYREGFIHPGAEGIPPPDGWYLAERAGPRGGVILSGAGLRERAGPTGGVILSGAGLTEVPGRNGGVVLRKI